MTDLIQRASSHLTLPLSKTPSPAAALAIGNTPLIRLEKFAANHELPEYVEIWLKTEWTNPGGSIKDRPALAIVQSALARGDLGSGQVLMDATSGNTGISYAMLGAGYGFPVEIVLPETASAERKQILRAYGATIIESDPYEGSNGAIRLARERAVLGGDRYFYADQYSNPANPGAHFETTGPEIWHQTSGRLTHFVAGLGTTGTLIGTGRFLKLQNPSIGLVAIQPSESFHGIEGLKHLPSAIVPAIYDKTVPDMQMGVDTDSAYELVRQLARTEGLFAGTSTGAALAGALAIGRELAETGRTGVVVAVAPDGGNKYLSTGLWSE